MSLCETSLERLKEKADRICNAPASEASDCSCRRGLEEVADIRHNTSFVPEHFVYQALDL